MQSAADFRQSQNSEMETIRDIRQSQNSKMQSAADIHNTETQATAGVYLSQCIPPQTLAARPKWLEEKGKSQTRLRGGSV